MAASRDEPLRLAYGDPPYPGMAQRYYSDHPDYAGEVDHTRLIEQLATFDGWALSTSAAALPEVLASCCAGETRRVRVAAWFRGARPHATAQAAVSSWEPVIYVPARPIRRADPGDGSRVIDSLQYVARARTTDPNRVMGAKPATFCRWLFEILGASPSCHARAQRDASLPLQVRRVAQDHGDG